MGEWDWVTISALATAAGTFALAVSTYASVRSANRAARTAELSLLAGLRPLLVESRETDPVQHVDFMDVQGLSVPGGGAAVEARDGSLYVVLSLRNVGPGIAVLHGGTVHAEQRRSSVDHAPLEQLQMLTRDLYIPPGDIGFWQIAFREDGDLHRALDAAIAEGRFSAEVLYGDYEGGQRVITRYAVLRREDGWQVSTIRHWHIDRAEPRQRG